MMMVITNGLTSIMALSAASAFLGADGVVAGRDICEASDEQAALDTDH